VSEDGRGFGECPRRDSWNRINTHGSMMRRVRPFTFRSSPRAFIPYGL
jgi:hypothetical protein